MLVHPLVSTMTTDEVEAKFREEFERLEQLLAGVHLLGDYNDKVKDEVLAQGELLSIKVIFKKLIYSSNNEIFAT